MGDIGEETDYGIMEDPDEFPAVGEPEIAPAPVAEPVPA